MRKLFSFIVLTITSAFYLFLITIPILPVLLNGPELGLAAIPLIVLSMILSPIAWVASYFSYQFISNKLKLVYLSKLVKVLTSGIITCFYLIVISAELVYLVITPPIRSSLFKVEPQMIEENIVKAENKIGVPTPRGNTPYLYEYRYKIKLVNSSPNTYKAIPVDVSLVFENPDFKGNFVTISLPIDRSKFNEKEDLLPGETIITGVESIQALSPQLLNKDLHVQTRVHFGGVGDTLNKTFYFTPSVNIDWVKVLTESTDFINKYQTID